MFTSDPTEMRARPNPTSLRSKLFNLYVSPGEVFDEVVASPRAAAHWRLPALLNGLFGLLLFFLVADPVPALEGPRGAAPIPVSSGAVFNPAASPGLELIGPAAVLGVSFAGIFWSAAVLWISGRLFLRSHFSFVKASEIAGLTTMILALGTITTALLVLATDNRMARPDLTFLAGAADPAGRLHQTLAVANVFHIWMAGLLSMGLAKLSGVSTREAAMWVFGYWIVCRQALIWLS